MWSILSQVKEFVCYVGNRLFLWLTCRLSMDEDIMNL